MKIGAVKEGKKKIEDRIDWMCDTQLDWVACGTFNEICSYGLSCEPRAQARSC